MKRLALVLLALSTGWAAAPPVLTVRTAHEPAQMCKVDNVQVSCAYLLALIQKIRDEKREKDRGI